MSPNPNLKRLHDAGVSIWLDTLSRDLLQGGEFQELIDEYSVTGATSNPTIFAKALSGSDLYDDQIRAVASSGVRDTQELFFALALDDIREAESASDDAARDAGRGRLADLVEIADRHGLTSLTRLVPQQFVPAI